MPDLALRHWIYDALATRGRAPSKHEVADRVGGEAAATTALADLQDAHMVVLGADGDITMALPFANRPTGHVVVGDEMSWWANCAWDALAIPAAIGCDATIEADWLDTGRPVDLAVRDGDLVGDTEGFVHFHVPARRWWDDIEET
ncbi:organomercurial lyase [Ilumatobacter fluminis]|nr:organomercurial lyase [Ilumatobacter fluminis]